jgi:hypothetical protein
LAGALQDTGRGAVIGTRTYGKGTVQQIYRHIDGGKAALKLTVGRYYTPSGAPVSMGEGRLPDVVVPSSTQPTPAAELRAGIIALDITSPERDSLLALVALLDDATSTEAPIPWHEPLSDRAAADPQLQRAIAELRTN